MDLEVVKLVIDSNNFTVGGGSASAIAGAMAAGMAGMVARLSVKKPVGFGADEYLAMADELDKLAKDLSAGAKKDTEAYLMIKNAFTLPKETDEEKLVRKKAVSDAGIAAASVPRDNGNLCERVYRLATSLQGSSNPAASSDLDCAVFLSEAGVKGCVLNIEANLSLIKDDDAIKAFEQDIENLKKVYIGA